MKSFRGSIAWPARAPANAPSLTEPPSHLELLDDNGGEPQVRTLEGNS